MKSINNIIMEMTLKETKQKQIIIIDDNNTLIYIIKNNEQNKYNKDNK